MYYWHQTCSFTTSFTLCPSSCSHKTLSATSFSCGTNTTNTRWSFFQCMTGSGTHLQTFQVVASKDWFMVSLGYNLHFTMRHTSVHPELRITSSFLASRSGFGAWTVDSCLSCLIIGGLIGLTAESPTLNFIHAMWICTWTEALRCGKEILFSGATSWSSE